MNRSAIVFVIGSVCVCGRAGAQTGNSLDTLRLAPPDAVGFVGIEWRRLLASPTGVAMRREVEKAAGPMMQSMPKNGATLVDWQTLLWNHIDSVLFVMPDEKPAARGKQQQTAPLVIVSGSFDMDALRQEAVTHKAGIERYRTVELLRGEKADSPDPLAFRVSFLDNRTILLGARKHIHGVIDRYLNGSQFDPNASELARRANQMVSGNHIWIAARVTPQLSQQAPHEPGSALWANLRSLDGGLNFNDGLLFALNLGAKSDAEAVQLAAQLKTLIELSAASQPAEAQPILKRLTIAPVHSDVLVSIALEQSELESLVQKRMAAVKQAATAPALRPQSAQQRSDGKVRIYGLDEGTREVPLGQSR